mgnify:CR=1 FL=1
MKFFLFNKEQSDPAIIINNCLNFLFNRISDDLDGSGHSWNKPWGVKRFESIVLAKFILDYSFEGIVNNQLSDDEKSGYYELSNTSFSKIFNAEFSEVGLNIENMQDQIKGKVAGYFKTQQENSKPPECYYQIYMLLRGSQSREELQEKVNKQTAVLELIRTNKNFAPMVTQCETEINHLKKKVSAFDIAGIMLPHMIRSAKQKLKIIKLKKIKTLSNKLAKKNKK